MANYDLFKNIDPGSITSATSSIRQKITTSKTRLSSFSSSLADGIWKAPSKATLKDAFTRIDSEVYTDIINSLDALDRAAGIISKYNDAKTAAETYKGYIDGDNKDNPSPNLNQWKSNLSIKEGIMEECERQINGMK